MAHTSHVEWVRAALRDELGISDSGGTVEITPEKLERLAVVAVHQTLNWAVAAAKNGEIEHAGGGDE